MYCYEPDGQEIVIDTLKSPWQLNCQGDFCYRIYKIKIDKFGNIIYDVKQMKWNYVGGNMNQDLHDTIIMFYNSADYQKLIEEIMSHVIEHLRIIVIRFMGIAQ